MLLDRLLETAYRLSRIAVRIGGAMILFSALMSHRGVFLAQR